MEFISNDSFSQNDESLVEDIFVTRATFFAAYLMASNFELVDTAFVTDDNGGHYEFSFRDSDLCKHQEKLFTLGRTTVETLRFIEAIKYLKKIIHK